ncbi:MAG: APC family permease [Caulobacteraceae bacterium]
MAASTALTGTARRGGGLLKVLGLGFGVAITVGSMIGSGILRTPGPVAAHLAAPALILALWLFGGVHAALECNLLAELSTTFPRAGGAYVYAERAFGPLGGLTVGWADWLSNAAAIAAQAIAFAEFAGAVWPWASGHLAWLALGVQVGFYGLSLTGVREGAWAQNLTTAIKVAALFALVFAALFAAPHVHDPAPIGRAGLISAAVLSYQLIVGVYTGWNSPAYFAEESVDPGRHIPRSMFIGVALVTALYMLVNLVLLRTLSLARLSASDLPLADLAASLLGVAAAVVVSLIAIVTVASCLNGNIMLAPRILFGLSRDRLFFRWGSAVNAGGTPWAALVVTAALSLLMTGTGTFEVAFRLLGLFTVLINILMTLALFRLRAMWPALERPFRARLYPWLPLAALAIDASLLVAFAWADPRGAAYGALLLAGAIPIWFVVLRAARRGSTPAPRGSA